MSVVSVAPTFLLPLDDVPRKYRYRWHVKNGHKDLYEELSQQGKDKVLWWGNRGVKLALKNQFGSQKCPPDPG
jgi:hypothetical protein